MASSLGQADGGVTNNVNPTLPETPATGTVSPTISPTVSPAILTQLANTRDNNLSEFCIDVRSDTVTLPDTKMRQVMATAILGMNLDL
jgi:hypothetical protein